MIHAQTQLQAWTSLTKTAKYTHKSCRYHQFERERERERARESKQTEDNKGKGPKITENNKAYRYIQTHTDTDKSDIDRKVHPQKKFIYDTVDSNSRDKNNKSVNPG